MSAIKPVNLLPSVFSPVHRGGDYSISKLVLGKHSHIFIICDTNFQKSTRTLKYTLFEIKILRNSDFASCAKFSAVKIICYMVVLTITFITGIMTGFIVEVPLVLFFICNAL